MEFVIGYDLGVVYKCDRVRIEFGVCEGGIRLVGY